MAVLAAAEVGAMKAMSTRPGNGAGHDRLVRAAAGGQIAGMRRVYKEARPGSAEGRHGVLLDGKPLRTPAGTPVSLPSAALAAAVAEEWQGQGERIVAEAMPLTRLACTVLDRVDKERASLVAAIAGYAETDLVCYRADQPASLVERQQLLWQPLVDWATLRFDAPLAVVAGVMHRPQPPGAVAALAAAVAVIDDPWRLLALYEATQLTGSLVIGLALLEGRLDAEDAWRAAHVEEDYQIERWGEDSEAARRRAGLRADLDAVMRFLALLDRR
jgi:chaperone required for assembly of F1-ATPase